MASNELATLFPSLFSKQKSADTDGDMSQYGDSTLSDEATKETGLLKDAEALGPNLVENIKTLIEEVMDKNKPYDDRTYLMERLIVLVSSLPSDSKNRVALSDQLIKTLWSSLQHPPLNYLSDQYMYRTADGSYNNVNDPNLGKSGTAYAKTVKSVKALHGAKPDPGLLFDLLLKREDGHFEENPAGINAVFFYHATLIIHDIFNSSHTEDGVNLNSSYLDLQTLYGNGVDAQNTIRTFKDGKLKPDAFADQRLLHQPPGCVVYLIMYNRYHNWVTDRLAAINEGGRFTIPNEAQYAGNTAAYQAAVKKRDEALFQTARLITVGLYANISIGDYVRAITNLSHSTSDWTLDPRVDIAPSLLLPDGLESGIGNAVSIEFNLLYRFHAPISRKDSQWMADFFENDVFKDRPAGKDVYDLSLPEWLGMFKKWADAQEKDPGKTTFGGLVRDEKTGCFDTTELVKIFTTSIEDVAGAFGAHNIPKHLKIVEMLGIMQARKWNVASLNEFRAFFGLKKHATFEEINSDPATADLLRKIYESPDMVELYPGLFVEDVKKRMDPGSAITPPFTVGRAVLSDAVTLVRSDRFLTVDYTSATLTAWGLAEVAADKKTMGGQMLYKLIQRTLPDYFGFNSVYCMQPMYLPSMTLQIVKQNKQENLFSDERPGPPRMPLVVNTHKAVKEVMDDHSNFKVHTDGTFPDPNLIFTGFCLSSDKPANYSNHAVIQKGINDGPVQIFQSWFESMTKSIIAREQYTLGKDIYQVDVVKDIGQVVVVHFLSQLFNLPLQTKDDPNDPCSEDDIYLALSTFLRYTSIPLDKAEAWNLRRDAQERTEKLKAQTLKKVHSLESHGLETLVSGFVNGFHGHQPNAPSIKEIGKKLVKSLRTNYSASDTAASLIAAAAGGVFLPHQFSITLDWFLREENASYWGMVKDLAKQDSPEAFQQLKGCVLEGQRLATSLAFVRVCVPDDDAAGCQITNDQGQSATVDAGTPVLCNITAALRDPSAYPDPLAFKPDRPIDEYLVYGWGAHMCPGREIAMQGVTAMIKEMAKLPGLRRAPGDQGCLKSVPGAFGSTEYLDKTWSKISPFTTTMKVHWDVAPGSGA